MFIRPFLQFQEITLWKPLNPILLFCSFASFLCITPTVFAQNVPCECTNRWEQGGTWNPDGSIDDSPNAEEPNGIIRCGSSAETQSQVAPFNNCTYNSNSFDIDVDDFPCVDPSSGEEVFPINPTEGEPIVWLNFDVRPFAGNFQIQINDNSGDNIAWALYVSDVHTTSTSFVPSAQDELSGDCNALNPEPVSCGVESSSTWNTIPIDPANFVVANNYYLAIWDQDADGDLSVNNFKARFGCGDADFVLCQLNIGDHEVICNSDNTYTVIVDVLGINGQYTAIDQNAISISDDICLGNAGDNNVNGSFTLVYPHGVDYNIDIQLVNPSTNNCVDGQQNVNPEEQCAVQLAGTAPDCCQLTVSCPDDLYIGSYTCEDVIPSCPTVQIDADGNITVDNDAGDYGIDVGDDPCGTIVIECTDDPPVNLCETSTITRTVTIFDDLDDDGVLDRIANGDDIDESFEVCVFTLDLNYSLTFSCPPTTNLEACLREQEIRDAYNEWVAGFTIEGGCNLISNIDGIPALPAYLCGGPVALEFTLTAEDDCNSLTELCTSTFSVTGVEQLALSAECPGDPDLPSCSTQEEIDQAWETWISSLGTIGVVGGCNGALVFSVPINTLVKPTACLEQEQTVSVEISAVDDCGNSTPSIVCTFSVASTSSLVVTCPSAAVSLPACSSSEEIQDAYNTWAAGFSVSGDCSSSNLGLLPALPAYQCGAGINLAFTLEATGCNVQQSCSSSFSVAAVESIAFTCPPIVDLEACLSEQAIQDAYDQWVAGFTISGGCNLVSNISDIPPLPAYVCGAAVGLEFALVASSDCGPLEELCQSSFSVRNADPLSLSVADCPGDPNLAGCASQEEIDAAWIEWITALSSIEAVGGCNSTVFYSPAIEDLVKPTFCYTEDQEVTLEIVAIDDCGQASTGFACTFNLEATGLPLISCPVLEPITCEEADDYLPPPAIVSGGCLESTQIEGTITGRTSDECGGTLTITYSGTDACGRTLEPVECTVLVICEEIEIEIGIPGQANCIKSPTLPGAAELPEPATIEQLIAQSIVPECIELGTLHLEVVVGEPVQVAEFEYRYERTYTLSGPQIATATAVEVLEIFWDSNFPVFTNLPEDIEVECGDPLPDVATGIEATDVEWGDQVTVVYLGENDLPGSCGDKVERRWKATDGCGCSTIGSQIISFVDNEPPLLIVPPDTTIECSEEVPDPSYEVSDNCSAVQVNIDETTHPLNDCEYRLIRTYTATDGCGRSTTAVQNIDVVDTEGPVITFGDPDMANLPNGGTMVIYGCETPSLESALPQATDNCCVADLQVGDLVVALNTCDIFGYYRKWRCFATATDAAGNTTEYEMFVIQYDTTAPVIHNVPGDMIVDCGNDVPDIGDAIYQGVEATDDCNHVTNQVNFAENLVVDQNDDTRKAIVRTWTVSDACGNQAEATQIISVCGFDPSLASSSIGNSVWQDINGNGIQEQEEPGINGVKVNLYSINENGARMLTSTTTNSEKGHPGYFMFSHLVPDSYQIEFIPPQGMTFAPHHQGEDHQMDSDADPANGMTSVILLDAGENLNDIDAGFVALSNSSVELVSFEVTSDNCTNTIAWATAAESNLEEYVIEYSREGELFVPVTRVDPRGSIDQTTQYSTLDQQNRARGQYRLKMIGYDGTVRYSDAVSFASRCIEDRNIRVFPNPFVSSFILEFSSDSKGDTDIQIADRLGIEVKQQRYESYKGVNRIEVTLNDLPVGTYFIKIQKEGWTENRMVIKTE